MTNVFLVKRLRLFNLTLLPYLYSQILGRETTTRPQGVTPQERQTPDETTGPGPGEHHNGLPGVPDDTSLSVLPRDFSEPLFQDTGVHPEWGSINIRIKYITGGTFVCGEHNSTCIRYGLTTCIQQDTYLFCSDKN